MSRDVLKSMSPPGAQHTPPLLTQEHAEWDLEYQRCRVPFCTQSILSSAWWP